MINDVAALLKPEIFGKADTPGISVFASSASDQQSAETELGGFGTVELLRCLRGETVVQTQRPYLDLVEVGRIVSDIISADGKVQTPLVWGINLYGQARFSKNPHFEGDGASLYDVTSIPPTSATGAIIRRHAEKLWSLYYDDPNKLSLEKFRKVVGPVMSDLALDEVGAAHFLRGFASTLLRRAQAARNAFKGVEVLAFSIAALLPYAGNPGQADRIIAEIISDLSGELEKVLLDVNTMLDNSAHTLVPNGLADLFYLPLRVTRILGWCAAQELIQSEGIFGTTSVARETAAKLINTYGDALTAMSDEQSPFLLAFLDVSLSNGWIEEGQAVLGSLFNSLHEVKGNVARPSIEPSRVFEYLNRRACSDFGAEYDLIGHPCEMLAVLMLMAAKHGMADVIDPYLVDLDHLHFNIFIPNTYSEFGLERIESGRNHTFEVGQGIWRVKDLADRWNQACIPAIATDAKLQSSSVRIGALCASFVDPDRSPWFLVGAIPSP